MIIYRLKENYLSIILLTFQSVKKLHLLLRFILIRHGLVRFLISQTIQKTTSESNSSLSGSNSGSKYPFTIDVTSEVGDLKQGFTVSIEVKNSSKALIVPITSVVMEEEKNFVWILDENKKAKKVEVGLGNADAENQEITSG